MANYMTMNTVAECVCFILAFICLFTDEILAWRCMVVFMLVTCAGELTGIYVQLHSDNGNNHWVYNTLLPFQIFFIHLQYFHLLTPFKKYRWMLLLGCTALIVNFWNDLMHTGFLLFSVHTYALLAVFNINYGLIYYYLKLDDDRYENLIYSAGFWWVAGNLFFSFGSTISNLFDDQLYSIELYGHHLTYYIFRGLNLILYSTWSYAFYCRRWKNLELAS